MREVPRRDGDRVDRQRINAIRFIIRRRQDRRARSRAVEQLEHARLRRRSSTDQSANLPANDMLFVASAGNNTTNLDVTPNYPASFDAPKQLPSHRRTTPTIWLRPNFATSVSRRAGRQYPVDRRRRLSVSERHVDGRPSRVGRRGAVLSHCAMDTASLRQNLLSTVDNIPTLAGRFRPAAG